VPFRFEKLEISGLILVKATVFPDDRGFFAEAYKHSEFAANGVPEHFVQDNLAQSRRGTLRGLHYQLEPQAQGKLVSVLSGEVYDVAVDIRHDSPTYGQWYGVSLRQGDHRMLYVPPGFAHGYCVTSDEATLAYKMTAEYAPERERGILWNDPAVSVEWPIADPRLSDRDADLPLLAEAENNFRYESSPPCSGRSGKSDRRG